MKPTPMAATMAKRHLDRGQHKNSSTINPAVPASSVHTVGVGFIGACVLLGPLFGLSPLSGRAWTLLGVFAAATPALMCLFVFLVSRVKQRLRRSHRAKHAAGLSATLS